MLLDAVEVGLEVLRGVVDELLESKLDEGRSDDTLDLELTDELRLADGLDAMDELRVLDCPADEIVTPDVTEDR